MKKWKVIKDAPLYVKEKKLKSGSIETTITFSSEPVDGYTNEKTYKEGKWIDVIFKKGEFIISEDNGVSKYPYTSSKFNLNGFPEFFEFVTNKIDETEEKCDECGKVCCTTNEIGEGRIHTCYVEFHDRFDLSYNKAKLLARVCAECYEPKRKEYDEKYEYPCYIGGCGCGH